jgi:hypothetical protein
LLPGFPPGAIEATLCPAGYRDRYEGGGGGDRTSMAAACVVCEAGKYGSHPERSVCFDCEPGFVCLEGATYGNPDLWMNDGAGRTQSIDGNLTVNSVVYADLVALNEAPYTGVGFNGSINGYPNTLSYQCPPGHYCPRQSPFPFPCPSGTYNGENRTGSLDGCLLCPAGTFNSKTAQRSCESCGSSASSAPGSVTCKCRGAHRNFNEGDKTCTCAPRYATREGATVIEDSVNGASDCQPIIYDNCAEGSTLSEFGDCLDDSGFFTLCSTYCPNGELASPYYNKGLGRCLCRVRALDEICDQRCRAEEQSRMQIACEDPPRFVLNSVLANGTTAEMYSRPTSELGGLSDVGILACPALDGRRLPTFLVLGAAEGLSGRYAPTTADLTAIGVVEGASSRRRRRRRNVVDSDASSEDAADDESFADGIGFGYVLGQAAAAASDDDVVGGAYIRRRRAAIVGDDGGLTDVVNPVTCLELYSVVLFATNGTHYPVFDKNNLLNYQQDASRSFDQSPFLALAETVQSLESNATLTFAYSFGAPGTWVLRDANTGRTSIFVVMNEVTDCPEMGPFFPPTASAQHQFSVSREDNLVVEPDWQLMGLLIGVGLALVLVFIGIVMYYRRHGWEKKVPGQVGYRRKAAAVAFEDYASKGSQLDRLARIHRAATGSADVSQTIQGAPVAKLQGDEGRREGGADAAGENTSAAAAGLALVSSEFWDYEQQVDLEGFDVDRFYACLQERSDAIRNQIEARSHEVKQIYTKIHQETSLLKSMWVSKLRAARPLHLVPSLTPKEAPGVLEGFQRELTRRKRVGLLLKAYLQKHVQQTQAVVTQRESWFATSDALMDELLSIARHLTAQERERQSRARVNGPTAQDALDMPAEWLALRDDLVSRMSAVRNAIESELRAVCQRMGHGQLLEQDAAAGGVLLRPGSDDEAVPQNELFREDGTLQTSTLVERKEELGLYVPSREAKMRLADGRIVGVPPQHFVHPLTGRVLPQLGHVMYNTLTGRLFVVTDAYNVSLQASALPYLPYPPNAPPPAIAPLKHRAQLRPGAKFAEPQYGLHVPVLACTHHPTTGEVLPVGGVHIDPLTSLLKPIELLQPMQEDGRLMVTLGVAFEPASGLVQPLGVPLNIGGNDAQLLRTLKVEPYSGAERPAGMLLPANADATGRGPSLGGTDLLGAIDGRWLQQEMKDLEVATDLASYMLGLSAGTGSAPAASFDLASASSRLAAAESSYRERVNTRSRVVHLFEKHSLDAAAALRDAAQYAGDGGVLGEAHWTDANTSYPIFAGQRLIDMDTQLPVPILGAEYEAEHDRHVPLGGVMHGVDGDRNVAIELGSRFVDGETGELLTVQGAKLDPASGQILPSDTPNRHLPALPPLDAGVTLVLDEEAVARRAFRRRQKGVEDSLLSEVMALYKYLGQGGAVDVSQVSRHVVSIGDTFGGRTKAIKREEKRRAQQMQHFSSLPPHVKLLIDGLEKQEAAVHTEYQQYHERVIDVAQRYVQALAAADVRRVAALDEADDHGEHAAAKAASAEAEYLDSLLRESAEFRSSLLHHLMGIHRSRGAFYTLSYRSAARLALAREEITGMEERGRTAEGKDGGQALLGTLEQLIELLQSGAGLPGAQPAALEKAVAAPNATGEADTAASEKSKGFGTTLRKGLTPTGSKRDQEAVVETHADAAMAGDSRSGSSAHETVGEGAHPTALAAPAAEGSSASPVSQRRASQAEAQRRKSHARLEELDDRFGVERARLEAELAAHEKEVLEEVLAQSLAEEARGVQLLTTKYMAQAYAEEDEAKRALILDEYADEVRSLRERLRHEAERSQATVIGKLAQERHAKLQGIRQQQLAEAARVGADASQAQPAVTLEYAEGEVMSLMEHQRALLLSLAAADVDSSGNEGDGESDGSVDSRMSDLASRLNAMRGGGDEEDGGNLGKKGKKDKKGEKVVRQAAATAAADVKERRKRAREAARAARARLEDGRAQALAALGPEATETQRAAIDADFAQQAALISQTLQQRMQTELHEKGAMLIRQFASPEEAEALMAHLREQSHRQQQMEDDARQAQGDELKARLAARRRLAAAKAAATKEVETSQAVTEAGRLQVAARDAAAKDAEGKRRLEQLQNEHEEKVAALELARARRLREAEEQLNGETQRLQEEHETALRREAEAAKAAMFKEQEASEAAARAKAAADASQMEAYEQLVQQHKNERANLEAHLSATQSQQSSALAERLAARRERKRKAEAQSQERTIEQEMIRLDEERAQAEGELQRAAELEQLKLAGERSAANDQATDAEDKEKLVHQVLRSRHMRETRELAQRSEREKHLALSEELSRFDLQRGEGRDALLEEQAREEARLLATMTPGSPEAAKAKARLRHEHRRTLNAFDKKTVTLRQRHERQATLEQDGSAARRRLDLRTKHCEEMVAAFKESSAEGAIVLHYEEAAAKAREATDARKREVEAEQQSKLETLKEQQAAARAARQQKLDEERRRVEAEVEVERKKHAAAMQAEMDRHRVETLKRRQEQNMRELQNTTDEHRKEVLERHRRELKALEAAMSAEQLKQAQQLSRKMEARREARRRKRLRELEEQAETEEEAQAAALYEAQMKVQKEQEAALQEFNQRPKTPSSAVRAQGKGAGTGAAVSSRPDAAMVTMLDEGLEPMLAKLQRIEALLGDTGRSGDGEEEDYLDTVELSLQTRAASEGAALTPCEPQDTAEAIVLRFGAHVASQLRRSAGFPEVTVKLASSLAPPTAAGGNAFRHSYSFDAEHGVVYMHQARAQDMGSFVLVLIHALAHVKCDTLANDNAGAFKREFFLALQQVCFDALAVRFTSAAIASVDGAGAEKKDLDTLMNAAVAASLNGAAVPESSEGLLAQLEARGTK